VRNALNIGESIRRLTISDPGETGAMVSVVQAENGQGLMVEFFKLNSDRIALDILFVRSERSSAFIYPGAVIYCVGIAFKEQLFFLIIGMRTGFHAWRAMKLSKSNQQD